MKGIGKPPNKEAFENVDEIFIRVRRTARIQLGRAAHLDGANDAEDADASRERRLDAAIQWRKENNTPATQTKSANQARFDHPRDL